MSVYITTESGKTLGFKNQEFFETENRQLFASERVAMAYMADFESSLPEKSYMLHEYCSNNDPTIYEMKFLRKYDSTRWTDYYSFVTFFGYLDVHPGGIAVFPNIDVSPQSGYDENLERINKYNPDYYMTWLTDDGPVWYYKNGEEALAYLLAYNDTKIMKYSEFLK